MTLDYVSNEEIVQAARRNLHQGAWDYATGGSETETTMRRNRLAFDRLAFRPRILVDVSSVDPSTTFLGNRLRIPAILAPIGSLQVFIPEGAAASAGAAAEFGTIQTVSSVTEPTLEETAASSPCPKIFQLYVHGDLKWCEEIVGRVKHAGYNAFCLTVDVAHYSRRERVMVSRWITPTRRTPPDPKWRSSVTWETMDALKQMTAGMPFMLKGVQTAEDAALAVEHGVDVIWVSNHGGRQIDHALGTMDTLPEIVQAVQGKARIVLDGGIQRGSDVAKALAMGADVVAIGKLQAWGLAAAGQAGLVRVLELLEDEMICTMGLIGVTCTQQLSPTYIAKAEPVTWPHEMSAWVNMPGGRIL